MFVPLFIYMSQSFHIVICANSESLVKKTIDYLEEKKYDVTIALEEEKLHTCFEKGNVILVIIELDYKPKDGITLTSDIRNIKDIEQPYIILFSNKQDDYIQITAFNAGADDYIVSPIKPILLEARISTLKKRLAYRTANILLDEIDSNFFVDREQYLIITKEGKYR